MAEVDRTSPVPIYHQLKTLVRDRIEKGVWRPGDRIPTEHELCRMYDISRAPVRQALAELTQEGLLLRRAGLGTFISERAPLLSLEEVSIRFMTSDPGWPRVLDYVARSWNLERHDPRITLDINVVAHDQFAALLNAAVGSGLAPDVTMVDCVWVAGLAQSGFLYALDEVGALPNRAEVAKGLYPAFVEANSYRGRMFGLPVKADVALLWYRSDWFAQEGLQAPRDWDELLSVSRHFAQPRVQERYGLLHPFAFPGGRSGGEATAYNLLPFIWSAGGDVFADGAVTLDQPATHEALQFLRQLATVHRVTPPDVTNYRWDTPPWALASGRVAMALGGSYQRDIILDVSGWSVEEFGERVGCIAPPAAPGRMPVPTVGGSSYVLMRQCRLPSLVMSVLSLATDPAYVGNLFRSIGQSSARPSYGAFLHPETDGLLTQVARLIESGRARPSVPEYPAVSRQLQSMFEAVLASAAPIEHLVQRTAEVIRAIVERS